MVKRGSKCVPPLQGLCQDNNGTDAIDDYYDTMRQGVHMAQEEFVIWERKRASIRLPSFQASTIMDLIVSVTWDSVNVPIYMNPRFRIVLSSQAILSGMLVAAGLVFSPGIN